MIETPGGLLYNLSYPVSVMTLLTVSLIANLHTVLISY